ncbi:methyltransferase domain-containing protein [Ditylenchus destructor]|nr:methyltransferase domain-containing protein [Ditylenchus destructor]
MKRRKFVCVMAICNIIIGSIYLYLRESESQASIDEDFFQEFPKNEMICLKIGIIGDTDDEPGYFVCDPENYILLYTTCMIHSVGVRPHLEFEKDLIATMNISNCLMNLYDKKKIEMPKNETSFNVVNVSRVNIGLVSTHYSIALKDHLHRNNFGYKFALLKVDIGRDGLDLVSTQEFGLQPCQLLITIKAFLHEINDFVLAMKFRAYLLFGIRVWKSSDEREQKKQYNLSFVKSYCIWESSSNYIFSKVWEKKKIK